MKIKLLLMIPLMIFLQGGACSSDDDDGSDDGTNNNFILFQDVSSIPTGGCNIQSDAGLETLCNYLANYQIDGLNYGIAISHEGFCRTGTFNLGNDFQGEGNTSFILQITDQGIPVETFVGVSGTVDLSDSGASSSMSFEGIIVSLDTGVQESIEGFVHCPL
ncbi:MAG: hypothetical protein HRU26_04765 [Psychroserpens sp.]|nr:hypothetical protein [Psychroserpens sp.]